MRVSPAEATGREREGVSRPKRLVVVLALNLVLVGLLVAVGVGAHSLGVLAEGLDYLADAAAIGISLIAIWLSGRPPTPARPEGHPRATSWAALINGGWLLVLTIVVGAAAIHRLVSGVNVVHGRPVLIVSTVAAFVMLAGAVILRGDEADGEGDDNDPGGHANMQAVLLDTAADAAAAASVAVTGAIILATGGNFWLDPGVALVVSVVIGYHAVRLLRRVVVALRSAPPAPTSEVGQQ